MANDDQATDQPPDEAVQMIVDSGGTEGDDSPVEQLAVDSTTNICLPFCLRYQGRSWRTWTFCGPSMESIAQSVQAIVDRLRARGWDFSATAGACPA